MFEAMHTGHSVYSTFHASNVDEAIARLTNPPINLPKQLLSSIGLIVIQHRNRRTGKRLTFQIAEINELCQPVLLMQHDYVGDKMRQVNTPNRIIKNLNMYTGMSTKQIYADIQEKVAVLEWLVRQNIMDINDIGLILSDYYTEKQHIMSLVKTNSNYKSLENSE